MTTARFFADQIPDSGSLVLSAEESHHAFHVLRLRKGDQLELFDGRGKSAIAQIQRATKKSVEASIVSFAFSPQLSSPKLHLFVALPKGDRQKTLIDGLTQLAVHTFTPLSCVRGVAQAGNKVLERLQKASIETCKQCRRNWSMEFQPVTDISRLETLPGAKDTGKDVFYFAHPGAQSVAWSHELQLLSTRPISSVSVAIGQEGGFDDNEATGLQTAGWKQIALGDHILRIVMAALAVASSLRFSLGDKPSPRG